MGTTATPAVLANTVKTEPAAAVVPSPFDAETLESERAELMSELTADDLKAIAATKHKGRPNTMVVQFLKTPIPADSSQGKLKLYSIANREGRKFLAAKVRQATPAPAATPEQIVRLNKIRDAFRETQPAVDSKPTVELVVEQPAIQPERAARQLALRPDGETKIADLYGLSVDETEVARKWIHALITSEMSPQRIQVLLTATEHELLFNTNARLTDSRAKAMRQALRMILRRRADARGQIAA